MNNTDKLIFIYLYICDCYDSELCLHYQRMSNNYQPELTDQEVLSIYLYCLLVEQRYTKQSIYNFADTYLRSWFPDLGTTYESFLKRINQLHPVFVPLIFCLLRHKAQHMDTENFRYLEGLLCSLVDSMPVVLAKGARSYTAKVAPTLCNRGYCNSKRLSYYGVKLHVMGFSRFNRLPLPEFVGITPASEHDLTVFKDQFETLLQRVIFGDKAYARQDFEQWLNKHRDVYILSPVKKKKGQEFLPAADKIYSTWVSQIRQPIEAFFNWLIEKTQIQNASKVRSTNGLLTHIFGRFAAAMFSLTFDFL